MAYYDGPPVILSQSDKTLCPANPIDQPEPNQDSLLSHLLDLFKLGRSGESISQRASKQSSPFRRREVLQERQDGSLVNVRLLEEMVKKEKKSRQKPSHYTVIEPFEQDTHLPGKSTDSGRIRVIIDQQDRLVARFTCGDRSKIYLLDPHKPVLDLTALPKDMSLVISADEKGVLERLHGAH